MEEQQDKNRQASFKGEEHWGLALSETKEYYKIIENKMVWNKQIEQWDKIGSSETDQRV